MATMTSQALTLRALERLGVKASDQPASAEDTILAQEQFDAAFAEYRYIGLCPFESSAIPEWAQDGLMQVVASRCSPFFGLGENPALEDLGRKKLAAQVSQTGFGVPVRAVYY
ncbi:MAG: hypothetical protein A2Y75_01650 [Candidatus Solincola sediminis]|uniref:Uncharacterized protein n=1 Tax=Candidatus Solincola sediminis TaxID=1797199 RepID=A0A1F2WNP5_9ACTN|nr:MAG: hypothetical protein A2Y75_01650 [Candidatus Solincola sediminis]